MGLHQAAWCRVELEAIVRGTAALGPIVSCASVRPTRKDARQVLGDRVKDNDSNVYIIVTGTGTIDHRDTIDITIQILLECRIIQVKRLAMKKALCVKRKAVTKWLVSDKFD